MIFSFYQRLKTIPPELDELASTYQLSWYQKLRWIELPFATPGLSWNSMVSVANGWFFLMSAEAFSTGNQNFRLPGLGAYMQTAVETGNTTAKWSAIVAMLLLVVALDRLLWRPVMAWAQGFQMDESLSPERPKSLILSIIRRSRLLRCSSISAPNDCEDPNQVLQNTSKEPVKASRCWVSSGGGSSGLLLFWQFGLALQIWLVNSEDCPTLQGRRV